jgi:hypothetical protein
MSMEGLIFTCSSDRKQRIYSHRLCELMQLLSELFRLVIGDLLDDGEGSVIVRWQQSHRLDHGTRRLSDELDGKIVVESH